MSEIRLDKWLWAARFFKTRSLARAAVEGGKVHVDGQRAKPSKTVAIGQTLNIRQANTQKTVVVRAVDALRKGAPEAALLYQETAQSLEKREQDSEQRRLVQAGVSLPSSRPTKKQRRQLLNVKHQRESDV